MSGVAKDLEVEHHSIDERLAEFVAGLDVDGGLPEGWRAVMAADA